MGPAFLFKVVQGYQEARLKKFLLLFWKKMISESYHKPYRILLDHTYRNISEFISKIF